jgi:O-antigen/teichoic acid export membrane protein
MLVLEFLFLVVALILATFVGIRNAKHNFKPSFRSHVELFLAGLPVGFLFTLLVLPEQVEALYLAAGCALLAGAIVSFSLPRQWRYAQESRNKPDSF